MPRVHLAQPEWVAGFFLTGQDGGKQGGNDSGGPVKEGRPRG